MKLHVVLVPYPVQGQINPMLQLAELLIAQPGVDVMVTMVHNKHNHDRIQQTRASSTDRVVASAMAGSPSPLPSSHAQYAESKLHFTWVDNGLPPDFDYTDVAGPTQAMAYYQSTLYMKQPLKQLLQTLNRQGTPVSCVLFGTFFGCAQSAAAELGIRTFMFWTQSAATFSIYYHMPLLNASGFFPYNKKSLPGCNEDDAETSTSVTYNIPGLPPLHPSSFPALIRTDNFADDPVIAILTEQINAVERCDGLLINSFEELEKDTYEALGQELSSSLLSMVGPMLPSAFLDGSKASDTTIRASLLPENSECIRWLDGRQKHSVLYIAFGSMSSPSAEELAGIGAGIKSCKQPYMWVIRPTASLQEGVADILPKDFVEETKDFGLIIPWAPQLQVLSHPSVGAFLTHCGWNSVLESLSARVPMISFPINMDQPTNSTYVCDIWKVGMALKRQDDGKVKSEDVEKVVRTVLHEEEGWKMRERVGKLRDAARQAVHMQGSSHAHIDKFIQGLIHT